MFIESMLVYHEEFGVGVIVKRRATHFVDISFLFTAPICLVNIKNLKVIKCTDEMQKAVNQAFKDNMVFM